MEKELRKYIRSVINENYQVGPVGNELIANLNNTVDNYIKQGVDVKAIKNAINIVLNSVERKAMEHIQSSISETEEKPISENNELIEMLGRVIDGVMSGNVSKEQAVYGIIDIIGDAALYTHQRTLEPSLNEKAEEIDEERITNPEGKEYVKNKENFIGSHVWGERLGDGSYVAVSYGEHFPLYIFWSKKNKWYENSDHYLYDGEPQDSTEEHRADLRPTQETRKKQSDWMRRLSKHLLKTNGMSGYEHISVEPGTKN